MDLVGNFCSFSESKRTETSLAALRFSTSIQFTRSPIPNTPTRSEPCCTARSHAHHFKILNFRGENFRDRKSNHEIHENIVPRKFGAIRYSLGVARLVLVITTNVKMVIECVP